MRVDCLEKQARLFIKAATEEAMELLVKDPSALNSDHSRRVHVRLRRIRHKRLSVTYKPRVDRKLGTVGDVTSIHFE